MPLADYPPMLLDERPLDLDEPGWIYELKYDGYRLMAEFGEGHCKLETRNGANATKWFPEVADILKCIAGGPHITDGEVCVFDSMGRSDFAKLQGRASRRRWYAGCWPVAYCVFDLLVRNGVDLTSQPLLKRKMVLDELFRVQMPVILLVRHFEENAKLLFQAAEQLKLEGIVAKRRDSPYTPGSRSRAWVKVKRMGAVSAERLKRKPK